MNGYRHKENRMDVFPFLFLLGAGAKRGPKRFDIYINFAQKAQIKHVELDNDFLSYASMKSRSF